MTVGSKIRTLRGLKGLTQEKMSELLDISSTSYSKMERDETDIPYSRLEKIASVFEISVLELLGFGEKNFYYFHGNYQNHANNGNTVEGGFVVNNSVPMEFNNMQNEIDKLKLEVSHLREMVEVLKEGR